MDVMTRRRQLMGMAGNTLVGIKQSIAVPTENSATITFPVESKPWGLLVACRTDEPLASGTKVVRVSAIWSDYGGGTYTGGRYAVRRLANPDHYGLNNSAFVYDDNSKTFSITVTTGAFSASETYYFWYFTIPF